MLANVVGEREFKQGLRRYIKQYAYANATTDQLYACFQGDIAGVVGKWTKLCGFPVIRVHRGPHNTLHLSQRRFLFNGEKEVMDPWPIPLTICGGKKNLRFRFLLDSREEDVALPLSFENAPYISLEWGMHRVLYSAGMTQDIVSHFQSLSSVDKISVLDNAYHLSLASLTSFSDFWKITMNIYHYERNERVLSFTLDLLKKVNEMFENNAEAQSSLWHFLIKFVEKCMELNMTSPFYRKLRQDCIRVCLQIPSHLYYQIYAKKSLKETDGDDFDFECVLTIRSFDEDSWPELLALYDQYREKSSRRTKIALKCIARCNAENEKKAEFLLSLKRPQDIYRFFLYSNDYNFLWNLFKSRYHDFFSKQLGSLWLSRMLKHIFHCSSDTSKLSEINELGKHGKESAQIKEEIVQRKVWIERNLNTLKHFIKRGENEVAVATLKPFKGRATSLPPEQMKGSQSLILKVAESVIVVGLVLTAAYATYLYVQDEK